MREPNTLGESHLAVNRLRALIFLFSFFFIFFFLVNNAFFSKNVVELFLFALVLDQNMEQTNSQTNGGKSLEKKIQLLSRQNQQQNERSEKPSENMEKRKGTI